MYNTENFDDSSGSSLSGSVPNLTTLFSQAVEMPSPIIDNDLSCMINMDDLGACSLALQDHLRFHPRCGSLVKVSHDQRSAERARPLDEYNNGVIMTHRPLYENEMFEIRIDKIIDKWSGSIEVGVTTHNPDTIRFPSTMTNMETGTIMMSGCKILVNGYGTCSDYGQFNLDELKEGDRIGMMRKVDGKLHYYINGVDQGVAAENIEANVWGVVDLYGMTVKVSIVEEMEDNNISMTDLSINNDLSHLIRPRRGDPSLTFHALCDTNVVIINDGKTAHRPYAFEQFTDGIVMTNRTLKTDELFQVRLDILVHKWAGSIEIGVTQLSCYDVQSPFKISNMKTGTWAIIGSDVIKDGIVVIPYYVRNLDQLGEGDTVGVMRKDLGILHFFVNGIDQGPAAFNVPEHVFGIIDLNGRVGQTTIVDYYVPRPITPETPNSDAQSELRFHTVHARNGQLSRDRMTAARIRKVSGFNYAVFFSSRPLRECEMFEIRIDKVYKSNGSFGFGVTAANPDELDPLEISAASSLPADTYVLTGKSMLKALGQRPHKYMFDLNILRVGARVGLMWHSDRSLHFYLDGMDQGMAFCVPQLNIYAVVDLFGACTQVTILPNEERGMNYGTNTDISQMGLPWSLISLPKPYCFSEYCGDNIVIMDNFAVARRRRLTDPGSALVFSAAYLVVDQMFEIKVLEFMSPCAGSLRMGVTEINILNAHVNRSLPRSIANLPHFTAYIEGRLIKYSAPGPTTVPEICRMVPSFEWLRPNDRIGFKKTSDGKVLIYYNSELMEPSFENVPDKVYVVMELYGRSSAIRAISKLGNTEVTRLQPCAVTDAVPTETATTEQEMADEDPAMKRMPYHFSHRHGRNTVLSCADTVARRTESFCDGLVYTKEPLQKGKSFVFRVDTMSYRPDNGFAVGVMSSTSIRSMCRKMPITAFGITKHCWIVTSSLQNKNGKMAATKLAAVLDNVRQFSYVMLHLKYNNELYLRVDTYPEVLIANVPPKVKTIYPVIDIYGVVQQVSILFQVMGYNATASLNLRSIPEFFEVERHDKEEKMAMRQSLSMNDIKQNVVNQMTSPAWLKPEATEEPVVSTANLQHVIYLQRLLTVTNHLIEGSDNLEKTWQNAAAKCSYIDTVYGYWKHLTGQFEDMAVAMSPYKVKCHCNDCDPDAPEDIAGWVRIEPLEVAGGIGARKSLFFHPTNTILEASISALDNHIISSRPDTFFVRPKVLPTVDPITWTDTAGKSVTVTIAVEVTLSGIRDLLKGILFNIHECE